MCVCGRRGGGTTNKITLKIIEKSEKTGERNGKSEKTGERNGYLKNRKVYTFDMSNFNSLNFFLLKRYSEEKTFVELLKTKATARSQTRTSNIVLRYLNFKFIHFVVYLIFQTRNSVRSSILSLKYQRFTPLGCKDKGVRRLDVLAIYLILLIFFFSLVERGFKIENYKFTELIILKSNSEYCM